MYNPVVSSSRTSSVGHSTDKYNSNVSSSRNEDERGGADPDADTVAPFHRLSHARQVSSTDGDIVPASETDTLAPHSPHTHKPTDASSPNKSSAEGSGHTLFPPVAAVSTSGAAAANDVKANAGDDDDEFAAIFGPRKTSAPTMTDRGAADTSRQAPSSQVDTGNNTNAKGRGVTSFVGLDEDDRHARRDDAASKEDADRRKSNATAGTSIATLPTPPSSREGDDEDEGDDDAKRSLFDVKGMEVDEGDASVTSIHGERNDSFREKNASLSRDQSPPPREIDGEVADMDGIDKHATFVTSEGDFSTTTSVSHGRAADAAKRATSSTSSGQSHGALSGPIPSIVPSEREASDSKKKIEQRREAGDGDDDDVPMESTTEVVRGNPLPEAGQDGGRASQATPAEDLITSTPTPSAQSAASPWAVVEFTSPLLSDRYGSEAPQSPNDDDDVDEGKDDGGDVESDAKKKSEAEEHGQAKPADKVVKLHVVISTPPTHEPPSSNNGNKVRKPLDPLSAAFSSSDEEDEAGADKKSNKTKKAGPPKKVSIPQQEGGGRVPPRPPAVPMSKLSPSKGANMGGRGRGGVDMSRKLPLGSSARSVSGGSQSARSRAKAKRIDSPAFSASTPPRRRQPLFQRTPIGERGGRGGQGNGKAFATPSPSSPQKRGASYASSTSFSASTATTPRRPFLMRGSGRAKVKVVAKAVKAALIVKRTAESVVDVQRHAEATMQTRQQLIVRLRRVEKEESNFRTGLGRREKHEMVALGKWWDVSLAYVKQVSLGIISRDVLAGPPLLDISSGALEGTAGNGRSPRQMGALGPIAYRYSPSSVAAEGTMGTSPQDASLLAEGGVGETSVMGNSLAMSASGAMHNNNNTNGSVAAYTGIRRGLLAMAGSPRMVSQQQKVMQQRSPMLMAAQQHDTTQGGGGGATPPRVPLLFSESPEMKLKTTKKAISMSPNRNANSVNSRSTSLSARSALSATPAAGEDAAAEDITSLVTALGADVSTIAEALSREGGAEGLKGNSEERVAGSEARAVDGDDHTAHDGGVEQTPHPAHAQRLNPVPPPPAAKGKFHREGIAGIPLRRQGGGSPASTRKAPPRPSPPTVTASPSPYKGPPAQRLGGMRKSEGSPLAARKSPAAAAPPAVAKKRPQPPPSHNKEAASVSVGFWTEQVGGAATNNNATAQKDTPAAAAAASPSKPMAPKKSLAAPKRPAPPPQAARKKEVAPPAAVVNHALRTKESEQAAAPSSPSSVPKRKGPPLAHHAAAAKGVMRSPVQPTAAAAAARLSIVSDHSVTEETSREAFNAAQIAETAQNMKGAIVPTVRNASEKKKNENANDSTHTAASPSPPPSPSRSRSSSRRSSVSRRSISSRSRSASSRRSRSAGSSSRSRSVSSRGRASSAVSSRRSSRAPSSSAASVPNVKEESARQSKLTTPSSSSRPPTTAARTSSAPAAEAEAAVEEAIETEVFPLSEEALAAKRKEALEEEEEYYKPSGPRQKGSFVSDRIIRQHRRGSAAEK